MKLFRWLAGRQPGVDYKKLCFLSLKIWKYGFDGYILRYEPNTKLPFHLDPVNGRMWRLNITLWGNSVFFIKNTGGLSVGWRGYTRKINLFRPDIQPHALRTYSKTYKLSFGFVKFK